jgi:hypothetical protein
MFICKVFIYMLNQYNDKTFHIKRNSTFPEIKFHLTQFHREKYDITEEMLENVGVTFSMLDVDTGVYRVANVPARLEVFVDEYERLDDCKYVLVYRPKLRDTKYAGIFHGEFKLDFLGDNCGKITLPTDDYIQIIISDSLTKTTVI